MTLQDQLEFIDITAPLKVDLIDSKGNAEKDITATTPSRVERKEGNK